MHTDSLTTATPFKRANRLPSVHWIALTAGIAIVFTVLAVSLHVSGFKSRMVYDSVGYLMGKGDVFSGHDPVAVMSLVPQRPLFMLTLYANYLVDGTDAAAYRWVNAVLLAISGLTLLCMVWMLMQTADKSLSQSAVRHRWVAVLVGLWFVVHPLQGFTVLYVWQRSVLMACLFSFAAITLYLAARTSYFRNTILAYVLTGILFAAGMLSKENVVMVPVVLFIAEIVLFKQSLTLLLKRAMVIGAVTVPGIVVNVVCTFLLLGPETERGQEGLVGRVASYYHMVGISPLEVILTQCRVFGAYLRYILVPTPDTLPFLRSFTISRSLVDPAVTLLAVAGLTALLLAGVVWCRKRPLACFGLFFFLVTLIPESFLIPQYLYFGHRPILPMAGVLLIMADCGLWLLDLKTRPSLKVVIVGALLLPTLYWGAVTYERSRHWGPLWIWEDAYAQLPPLSPHVEKFAFMDILGNYATELSNSGRHAEAVDVLRQAVQINFGLFNEKTVSAKINLGTELFKSGENEEGLLMLKRMATESPDFWQAHFELATALAESGDRVGAEASLRKAIQLNPKNAAPCVLLANLVLKDGRSPEAISLYKEALRRGSQSEDTYNRLGIALEKSGDLIGAVENYRKAVAMAPRSSGLHFNLAKTLTKAGNVPDAISSYQRAVALKPNWGPAQANLGTLLLRSGRMNEAIVALKKAMELVPKNSELHFQTAIALLALGRKTEAEEHLEEALVINPRHRGARDYLDRLVNGKDK